MVLFALDALVDLFTVNRDVFWCIHANTDLIALHTQDGNRNFVADHHGLADSPGQYQHNPAPCMLGTRSGKVLPCYTPLCVKRSFVNRTMVAIPTKILQSIRQEYKNTKRNCC